MRITTIMLLLVLGIGWLLLSKVWEWRSSSVVVTENSTLSPAGKSFSIKAWHGVNGIQQSLVQFDTVFWEPRDTELVRQLLLNGQQVSNKRVLEIGTGTGLLAIAALLGGASQVVATDINPAAVANALYNAEICGVSQRLAVRQVPFITPGPFAVIDKSERFDLILANPPWEDSPVQRVDQFAIYDPGMALCDGLLEQGQSRLESGGVMWLIYGAKSAVRRILAKGNQYGWEIIIRDQRELDDLPEVFLPAMLIELKPLSNLQR